MNEKGFKVLDSHIGCIYGDAITYDRCGEISVRLMNKGFASTNMVYGIGSFTYQYTTRDTFGFALKSTAVTINGEEIAIYKNPVTDNGVKKSQKGRVAVLKIGAELKVFDGFTSTDYIAADLLQPVFQDGKLLREEKLSEIRERLLSNL